MVVEARIIFSGRVQGVGFRWTVVEVAERYGIVGCVKNLSNGSVEVIAQSSKESIDLFVENIKLCSGGVRIDSVNVEYKKAADFYGAFTIVY